MGGGILKNFRRLRRRIIRGDPLPCAIRIPPLIRIRNMIRGGILMGGGILKWNRTDNNKNMQKCLKGF